MKLINKQQKLLIQTELETLERERIRIAKDLHDSVSPNILAAKLITKNIIKKYEPESIETIESQFQAALKEIKSIVYDLEPPGLIQFGLQSGLKNYIDRITSATLVKVDLKLEGDEIKELKITIPIFRILQELISNTLKHSQADHITLLLQVYKERIKLLYTDNGIGFDKTKIQPGLGLHNIESRVLTLNGELQFNSGSYGVYYEIDIPLDM
jgi:signal transduction histidine kinase